MEIYIAYSYMLDSQLSFSLDTPIKLGTGFLNKNTMIYQVIDHTVLLVFKVIYHFCIALPIPMYLPVSRERFQKTFY